jgi:SAM-dependent methyltransferase
MGKIKSKAVWGATPAGATYGGGAVPGSKDFFESVVYKRSTYEMPWLYEIVPFSSFRRKSVLELGCGAGYDAYELCRNGAYYTGIDITPQNIERTKKHLGYYGYSPEVLEGDAENLSFEGNTFDMVFSNGVLHHTPDIERSFREAYRVLRPGGEFWVILYHKHSVFYWLKLFFTDQILKFGFLKRSLKERLSMIEYTTSKDRPLVNVYSRSQVRKLLHHAGFSVESMWVRKLLKEDLPEIYVIWRLWQYIPQRWLDFLGKYFGWYVIAKATKPCIGLRI